MTRKIVEFIRSHGADAEVLGNGRLRVTCDATYADGSCGQATDEIEATVRAARAWLGY